MYLNLFLNNIILFCQLILFRSEEFTRNILQEIEIEILGSEVKLKTSKMIDKTDISYVGLISCFEFWFLAYNYGTLKSI